MVTLCPTGLKANCSINYHEPFCTADTKIGMEEDDVLLRDRVDHFSRIVEQLSVKWRCGHARALLDASTLR